MIRLIILFSVFCFLLSASSVGAATLSILPRTGTFFAGSLLPAKINLDTEDQTVNAVQVKIFYPEDLVKVVSLSEAGSPIQLWQERPKAEAGAITFSGGIPGGWRGQGTILTVVFQLLRERSADVTFDTGSVVLLHDGKATPANLKLQDAIWQIGKAGLPNITSPMHQNGVWSKNRDLTVRWPIREDWEYSYLFTNNLAEDPDDIADDPHGGLMTFKNLPDGIWKFALRARQKGSADWLPRGTFLALIDATPPQFLEAKITSDPAIENGRRFVSFSASDNVSGVSHYEICDRLPALGTAPPADSCHFAENPYFLTDQNQPTIVLAAIDNAGNAAYREVRRTAPEAWPIRALIGLFAALLATIVGFILRKYRRAIHSS